MRNGSHDACAELHCLVFPFERERDLFFGSLRGRKLDERAELADVDERAFERPMQTNAERTWTYAFRPTTIASRRHLGGVQVRPSSYRPWKLLREFE